MFLRSKKSGRYEYLQIVHNERVDGRVRQQVLATLGRLDQLRESGQLDSLIASLSRFSELSAVLGPRSRTAREGAETIRIGPALLFERLWEETGIRGVLTRLLRRQKFEFDMERAIFLTVLHRLFSPGSDRAAEYWRWSYRIAGTEELELHHLYRAMGWLGRTLPAREQVGATPLAPRTQKDRIEEELFAVRRDLFSSLDLVFFDTTSLYFEGQGGETLGRFGKSKDHRPDRRQMVVGAVLDNAGQPICSEMWPGNTADVTTLVPVVDRLQDRFGIQELCIVGDRGMISKATIAQLKHPGRRCRYILGARMRAVKEIREVVLADSGAFEEVRGARIEPKDPAPLQVKEVRLGGRRYVVCFNPEQAAKDRADREAILQSLEQQLRRGDKSLVGNKGYRKYLSAAGPNFGIDWQKAEAEARFDGHWVLETDLDLPAAEVALKYKELWQVEALFRSVKTVLETRPIYHQRDDTIQGHVFCSFLALVLLKELKRRMEVRGFSYEWARLRDDLDDLEEIRLEAVGRKVLLRSIPRGDAARALQAAGVALGPAIRFVEPARNGNDADRT
jgi:hypothetical protein